MTSITLFDAAQAVREAVNQKVRVEMSGKVYGELTILSFSHLDSKKTAHWLVRCSCGTEKTANGSDIRSGKIKSCGHLKRSRGAANQYRHGHAARGGHTRTYVAWRNMLDRCNSNVSVQYADYGGRGIRVCQQWQESFSNFLRDIGEIPPGMSLERINVNGNYEPSNCTVIPLTQQVHNRRNTVRVVLDGQKIPLSAACRMLGVSYSAAIQRARRGLPDAEILHKGKLCKM